MTSNLNQFTPRLLAWFDRHGRKNLPWKHPISAYRIWIAEIMLQQTQVKTVIPYFNRFMESFPDIKELAKASEDSVLAHWSGLGYYSRARNIFKTAKILCRDHNGEFPRKVLELIRLPGIGPSTAAAITSQAFNKPDAILDCNVKRVLCRYFLIDGWSEQALVKKKLWQLAQHCMSDKRCADYTQAIMDFGATCCTKNPDCKNCPLQETCLAHLNNKVSQYPKRKPPKILPNKQQQFLLLYTNDNKIYLEKRPPTGLWGGLWTTPIIDINHCPIDYVTKTYALICSQTIQLAEINHSFSHFKLRIKGIAIRIDTPKNHVAEYSGKWLEAEDVNSMGIAKPIRELIDIFLSRTR